MTLVLSCHRLVIILSYGACPLQQNSAHSVLLMTLKLLHFGTTFPDHCLCTFLYIGLNAATHAQLPREGPRGSFASYVEWVLASCGSAFTIEIAASPTSHPVPSQNHPDGEDKQPEPTAGSTTETAVIEPPTHTRAIGGQIATESEQRAPDQVCEPAEPSIAEGVLVDFEGSEVSPTHPPATESEFFADTLLDLRCGEDIFLAPVLSPVQLRGTISGLPESVSSWAGGARSSASSLGRFRAASFRCPDFCACAPSALGIDHRPFDHAGLPRHVSITWVRHRVASAADLRTVHCSLVLHPFHYGLLRPTSGSISTLGRSNTFSDLRIPSSISGDSHCSSVAAAWIFTISTPPQLVGCPVGSILVVVAYDHPHGGPHQRSTMAPPSINAAVGHYPDCGLEVHPAAPAQGHHLDVTTICATLDSWFPSPPSQPSTS
ncbi:hypothetical protein DPX16_9214 [Anabarilius grahami]|uniref:Uncharacterized protein n=1 Tax=Anabarilius grahami TaxID=495550 RepID=A0A3N0Y7F2_ANAGA|nr:hypothetical protein DPX16_9214 [Anabarilius grahami]